MSSADISIMQGYPLTVTVVGPDGKRTGETYAVIAWGADGDPIGVRVRPPHGPGSAAPVTGPKRITDPYVVGFPSVDITGSVETA